VKRRPGGPLALRTAKACGPVPPTLGSSLPCDHAGGRRRLKSPVLRGERAIGRKHHRAGNAGLSRLPCCCRREQSALFFARRARGCGQHPAFPAPSGFFGGTTDAKPGRIMPRECGGVSSPRRHCERSEAIQTASTEAVWIASSRSLSSGRPKGRTRWLLAKTMRRGSAV